MAQQTKYYEVNMPDGTFKVKQCDKQGCGAEIFWDQNVGKFIDLHARNEQKNWHWNFCVSNPARVQRSGQSSPPPPPQQLNQTPQYTGYGKPDTRPNTNPNTSLVGLQSQGQETIKQDQIEEIKQQIERINNTVQMLYNTVTAFVEYNPTIKSFEAIIEAMIKYLPEPTLTKPKNAFDMLSEDDGESMGSDDINPINKFD